MGRRCRADKDFTIRTDALQLRGHLPCAPNTLISPVDEQEFVIGRVIGNAVRMQPANYITGCGKRRNAQRCHIRIEQTRQRNRIDTALRQGLALFAGGFFNRAAIIG